MFGSILAILGLGNFCRYRENKKKYSCSGIFLTGTMKKKLWSSVTDNGNHKILVWKHCIVVAA
jgi:hypothetical protein